MKNLLLLLSVFLMMSCGTFKVSTLSYDPIYTTANGETIDVNVVDNEWELNRLLRDDFRFRYDYAQYAKSQPISFDWNNRILRNNRFNRYNFNNRYSWSNGYYMNSYWNRDLMWDDWLWGNYGMGWSYSWNNRSWSSNQWGWNGYYGYGNPYGWNNNIWGWNNYNRYRGTNVAYHSGRRSSNNVVVGRRTNTIKNRVIVNRNKPRLVVDKDVVIDKAIIKLRGNNNNIRVYENPNNIPNKIIIRNNKPVRNYNRPENNNRNSNNNINRNNNNSRPIRTYSPPPRTTPTRSSTPVVRTKGRGNN